ncbi:unnamed protein product [Penicillium olsonii]|nr:unnamed protein product [Penicillium olsonii]
MDRKVRVTLGYISELRQRAAQTVATGGQHGDDSTLAAVYDDESADREETPGSDVSDIPHETRNPGDQEPANPEPGLFNPLANGSPAFMSSSDGRIFYLGTSSNWSFTRRVLSMAHQHVYQQALPTDRLIFEGSAYDLSPTEPGLGSSTKDPTIPSIDHALYLTNTVNFRCGQIYHLFEEYDFLKSLHEFYATDEISRSGLWYIHFLLILAFGRTFTQAKTHDDTPAGLEYFAKAMQLLPDHNQLYLSPMISTEILCCIAIFYQSLDCRSAAHNYIGQAMRLAMSHGMHTSMPVSELGLHVVERCRKIWWTIDILNRQMTCVQGLPQSIDDNFVQTSLPSFAESPLRALTLDMHIKLSRSVSEINKTVYAIDGRINRKFLLSTKEALTNLAGTADELQSKFPLYLDDTASGVPRVSAYLHLFYQQCVIVATRPLLFCFLKVRFESPETCAEFLGESQTVRNLIQMCLESAQHTIRILMSLKSQGLLETSLAFDLESIYTSTVVLLIGPAIDHQLMNGRSWWPARAYEIFREMVDAGNRVARLRWSELQQLDLTLREIPSAEAQPPGRTAASPDGTLLQLPSPDTSLTARSMDQGYSNETPSEPNNAIDTELSFGAGSVWTSAEMTAMADSIDFYDAEWVSNAMAAHGIW